MKTFRSLLAAGLLALCMAGASAAPAANAINVIAPYKHHGMWVFDDPQRGLRQEAFVSGADTWMDKATARLPDATHGFALVFSAEPFPDHQFAMERRRLESGGAWYYSRDFAMEGWLCSALLRYFPQPPAHLYAQVKPRTGAGA